MIGSPLALGWSSRGKKPHRGSPACISRKGDEQGKGGDTMDLKRAGWNFIYHKLSIIIQNKKTTGKQIPVVLPAGWLPPLEPPPVEEYSGYRFKKTVYNPERAQFVLLFERKPEGFKLREIIKK